MPVELSLSALDQFLSITDLTDERTFEKVFRTFYEPLCRYSLKYVEDPDVAEEIVQELFTSIWVKAGGVTIRTSLKSYLYGATRNACLNYLKHQKVKRAHEEYVKYHHSDNDDDLVEFDELQTYIGKALEKLPTKCREVFELCRFEEMKYKEVAEKLGISIKTVENQMGKALKLMKKELEQYLPLIIWGLIQSLILIYAWG